MKKNKTRILSLVGLTLLFSAGLIGCGGGDQGGGNQGGGGGGGQQAETKINITAEGGKTTLLKDETVQLTADVQGVTWESLAEDVAEVSTTGLVTAKGIGDARIRAKKDGYKTGSITITVQKAPEKAAKYMIDMEKAEHYDPDGFWGMSWGTTVMGPGDSPVEDNSGATEDGHSLGWLTQGCKETLKFTANKAVEVGIGLRMAYYTSGQEEFNVGAAMTSKFNTNAVSLTGITFAMPAEQNYYDWHNIEFGKVTLNNGENVFEIEMIAQGPNVDQFLIFTEEELTITPILPPQKQEMTLTASAEEVTVGSTITVTASETGVAFSSSDENIATVDANGVVTGVAKGKVTITAKKEGFKDAKVEITVVKAPVQGQILLEAEDGVLTAANPDDQNAIRVEDKASASCGKSVGYFQAGSSIKIEYESTTAFKANLGLAAAASRMNDQHQIVDANLAEDLTLTFNEGAVDLTGKTLPGNNSFNFENWQELDLGEVDVQIGKNTILLTAVNQGPNVDYFTLTQKADPAEIIKSEQKDLTAAAVIEAEVAVLDGGARVENKAKASGGKSVGYMAKDASITLTFTASGDGKAELILVGGSANADWSQYPNVTYNDHSLYETATLTINGKEVSLANRGYLGEDGDAFVQANLGQVDVKNGENTLVITALEQAPNFDAFAFISDLTIEGPHIPEAAVTGAVIAENEGNAILTLSGTSKYVTSDMLGIDLENYDTKTKYQFVDDNAPVITIAADGSWTMSINVTACEAGRYVIHFFFQGTSSDLNITGLEASSITLSEVTYEVLTTAAPWSSQWWTAYITELVIGTSN